MKIRITKNVFQKLSEVLSQRNKRKKTCRRHKRVEMCQYVLIAISMESAGTIYTP